MNYLDDQKRTLSFRRLPFAAKRRRARPILGVLSRVGKWALVALPLVAGTGWLLGSNQFGLAEIEIRGVERVDPEWIRTELADETGTSLVLLNLDRVQKRLSAHPWISSLRLKKEMPARLVVRVVEHVPAAVLIADDGRYLLSTKGRRIIALAHEETAHGLLIDGRGTTEDDRQLAGVIGLAHRLEESGARWAAEPVGARILSPEDLEFSFGETEFTVRLRSTQTAAGLEQWVATLDDLLPQLRDRFGTFRSIDLRFERRIVIAPSSEGQRSPRQKARADSPRTTGGLETASNQISEVVQRTNPWMSSRSWLSKG